MCRRSKIRWIAVAGVLVAATGLYWWMTSPRHNINEDSFSTLKRGMTREEVQRVFWVPPGDYGPGKGEIVLNFLDRLHWTLRTDPQTEKWLAGPNVFYVVFDEDGRLKESTRDYVYREYDSFWHMLLHKVHLKDKKVNPFGFTGVPEFARPVRQKPEP